MDGEAFWLVWCEESGPPRYKHCSLEDAQREAKRLAREVKGKRFVILHAVEAYEVQDVMKINLVSPIPF